MGMGWSTEYGVIHWVWGGPMGMEWSTGYGVVHWVQGRFIGYGVVQWVNPPMQCELFSLPQC